MMDFCVDIRKDFKAKLQSRIEFFHRCDAITQFMTIQIKNRRDMERLRQQVEDQKKVKESYLESNQLLKQKLKESNMKKENLLKEISDLKTQEQEVIKHRESRVAHVRYLWKSYILAIDFYKSRLNCHIELLDDLIIWSFTNLSVDSKKAFMVKLKNQDDRWSCTAMVPKLKNGDALMEMLKETNDIQGFLSTVRSRFKRIAKLKN
ncbi:kinetochore protein Spc25-like [Hetaerina americana]|uniref:kinetochore protein Spc25-like n=1 Tax=Hetaerina americana TaxID=62018 RepID=UPI003A7F41CA